MARLLKVDPESLQCLALCKESDKQLWAYNIPSGQVARITASLPMAAVVAVGAVERATKPLAEIHGFCIDRILKHQSQ